MPGGRQRNRNESEMASKLEKFENDKETWQRFVQRVRLYFVSAGVPDNAANTEKRRAILLQGMGIELFSKFCDSAGDDIENLTFDQIAARVQTLINPAPLEIYERYRFHTRTQQSTESAADYMVALRKIALTCNFANDGADNADPTRARLRDQFVCGLARKDMQRHLLQQPALTIDNVVQLAQSFESAEKTTALFGKGMMPELEANAVMQKSKGKWEKKGKAEVEEKQETNNRKKPWKGKCQHCGKENSQPPEKCFYKTATCYQCGEKGHIRSACDQEESTNAKGEKKRKDRTEEAHGIIVGDNSSDDDDY